MDVHPALTMFSPAPGAGLPAPHPALALPRWLHRLDEVSALGNKIHPRARGCNPSLRPSRPRSHSCKSRSEDMYASAGSWRCMQPGGGSLAGANFWAVATSRCLIGQRSEQEVDYCCLMRRLQRHSIGPRRMRCTSCLTWS